MYNLKKLRNIVRPRIPMDKRNKKMYWNGADKHIDYHMYLNYRKSFFVCKYENDTP